MKANQLKHNCTKFGWEYTPIFATKNGKRSWSDLELLNVAPELIAAKYLEKKW